MRCCPLVVLCVVVGYASMVFATHNTDHIDSVNIDGELFEVYTFEGSDDYVTYAEAKAFCNLEGYQLATLDDFYYRPNFTELSNGYDLAINEVKADSDIYFRSPSGQILKDQTRILMERSAETITYSEEAYIYIDNDELVVELIDETSDGVLCERTIGELPCPDKDCLFTTNKPYEDWEVHWSNSDLTYTEAMEFCAEWPGGELLPLYSSADREWVQSMSLPGNTYFQPLTNDPATNTPRWPGGWALLDGYHPNRSFTISPDEPMYKYEDLVPPFYFPVAPILTWNSASNIASFTDIKRENARALCKVPLAQKDECDSDPCQNGATCADLLNGFQCICLHGYIGTHCEIPVDDCEQDPCYNGGSCEDETGDYTCTCAPGYQGDQCQINIDECASQPCVNGGECKDGVDDYACLCASGYAGTHCEEDIDDCVGLRCHNEGICTDAVDGFSCTCQPGYAGTYCENDINECMSYPCHNSGVCTNGKNMFTCDCAAGYTGDLCQTDINECMSYPCHNSGVCKNGKNTFTCDCAAGYTGDLCQTDIDECRTYPCLNGGRCLQAVNRFICDCNTGYTGSLCETKVDGCEGDPCSNGGTCKDGTSGYTCDCPPLYTGTLCETRLTVKCLLICENGGTCAVTEGSQLCRCTTDYTGPTCGQSLRSDTPLIVAATIGAVVILCFALTAVYVQCIRSPGQNGQVQQAKFPRPTAYYSNPNFMA